MSQETSPCLERLSKQTKAAATFSCSLIYSSMPASSEARDAVGSTKQKFSVTRREIKTLGGGRCVLVFYWGLYPSYTALYAGCRSQRVTNSNSVYEYSQQKTYYSLLYTLVQILLRAVKSRKKRNKIQNKPSNKRKENKRIKMKPNK